MQPETYALPEEHLTINRDSLDLLLWAKGNPEAAKALVQGKTGKWQPIETAPKDGTEILGYWKASKVMGVCAYFDGGVYKGWSTSENDAWVSAPTHWMPLPPPPHAIIDTAHDTVKLAGGEGA